MDTIGKPSTLQAILRQLCPRCRSGKIFRSSIFYGLAHMYERCPVCSLKYEREQGYFLGAMYISYGLALVTIVILGSLALVAYPLAFRSHYDRNAAALSPVHHPAHFVLPGALHPPGPEHRSRKRRFALIHELLAICFIPSKSFAFRLTFETNNSG